MLTQSLIDALILLWCGGPKLLIALRFMKKWGFVFKTVLLVWCKITKKFLPVNGLGYWTRASCELLLMGSKGNVAGFRNYKLNVNQLVETVVLKSRR